jgi:hypothetical protein
MRLKAVDAIGTLLAMFKALDPIFLRVERKPLPILRRLTLRPAPCNIKPRGKGLALILRIPYIAPPKIENCLPEGLVILTRLTGIIIYLMRLLLFLLNFISLK